MAESLASAATAESAPAVTCRQDAVRASVEASAQMSSP